MYLKMVSDTNCGLFVTNRIDLLRFGLVAAKETCETSKKMKLKGKKENKYVEKRNKEKI